MEILLASNNTHKLEELREILPQTILLKSLQELGFKEDIEETGNSFEENAFIKAKTAYDFAKIPVLADDSGLCIESLNFQPGIYSARFAGTGNAQDNIKKVLNLLENEENRRAYFISVLCFYDGIEPLFFEGRIYGTIIDKIIGSNGFGYDPIFIPDNFEQTFAQLSSEEKNAISHRNIALNKFIDYISIN